MASTRWILGITILSLAAPTAVGAIPSNPIDTCGGAPAPGSSAVALAVLSAVCALAGVLVMRRRGYATGVVAFAVAFGLAWSATHAISDCSFGRKYAQAAQKIANLEGVSAKIRQRNVKLCDEPNSIRTAASVIWAGVTQFECKTPKRWAQTGIARDRRNGVATVTYRSYTEVTAGPEAADYELYVFDAPPAGSNPEYKCDLDKATGKWSFYYDGAATAHHTFTRDGWKDQTGTIVHWTAEIFNKEDDMVGTAKAPCDLSVCQTRVTGGAFAAANLVDGDLYTDDEMEWAVRRISATEVEIRDRSPQP